MTRAKPDVSTHDEIDRFLTAAETVTARQWEIVYSRFADRIAIRRAMATLYGISSQASLARHLALPLAMKDKRDPRVLREVARIEQIAGRLPETILDERGGQFRQRIEWILINTRSCIATVDALKADPKAKRALSTFKTLYDDVLELPQFD